MKFIKPIDGDVLFSVADGIEINGNLIIKVIIFAEIEKTITVNGVKTTWQDGVYTALIQIDAYRNAIEAKIEETGETQTIYIYWFKNAYKTYRLGIDDVIWCFENIYNNQQQYQSLFNDPFLAIYKELHQTYGTKVHMHIYYETDDKKFNLSMFPDKYKSEFKENASWLRFTFHSRSNFPDSPYKDASYDLVMKEGKMVEEEIRRFAGSEVLANVTSQHWADSNVYGTRAFRALGYKVLDGYFVLNQSGEPIVSYYLNKEQTLHAHCRDFWVDNKEDIIFVKDDIIINEVELGQIESYMNQILKQEDHCFMYLLIHEQYFYKNYEQYQIDYKEKIFKTVSWCEDHGYKTTWISDIAFENKWND